MIQLVIFDMDGLMFDTETIGLRAMRQATKKFGYTLTDEFYSELVGTNGTIAQKRIIDHFGNDYPLEEVSQECRRIQNEIIAQEGITIKKGLRELLAFLKEKHIKTCVASSSSRQTILRNLKMTGLENEFAFLMAGDEVRETKPNPEIFLKTLDKAGASACQALVLEDSQNGIIASHQANIPVICIPDLKMPEANIRQLCKAVLSSLDQVIDYLDA